MREKVIYTIETNKMINCGDGIVVGLSGGPDSVCMLHILNSLRQLYDIRLYAVHLNHMIRGEEADRDEQYAREFSNQLGIPFISRSIDVPSFAAEHQMSEEEAGRYQRYKLFEEIAQKVGAKRIAIAHNMNDQAETVIMHFLRGSGISGMGGIRPIRAGRYIRPLIYCTREEIEAYCSEQGLSPMHDSTNSEDIYARNKLRLELMPYLQNNFNPNIIECISKAADLARQDDDYLNSRALIELEKIKKKDGISVSEFNLLHISIKRRIIRLVIEKAKGSLDNIESKHIEDCIDIISKGRTGKCISLPDGVICRIQYDCFQILKRNIIEDFQYSLPDSGIVYVNEADMMVSTRLFRKKDGQFFDDRFIKYFDYDKIGNGLIIRNRRNGDYICPKGMKGTKKLKDYFIDKKVPSDKRQSALIIAAGSEVLWLIGMRDTRNYKIDEVTENIIEIKLERCKHE
jgi:tRNA(Ile)-lysidine synthase